MTKKPPYKPRTERPSRNQPPSGKHPRRDAAPLKPGAHSRLIIARTIQTVWGQGCTVEEALEKQAGFSDMSVRDRAFARNVVSLTFRRWAQIDYVLKQYLKKQPPLFIMAILRSAVAQSLFLKMPDHAVVGESVAAMKSVKTAKGFAGMANAVLRRITENGASHLGAVPPHENVPKWILRQWEKEYGRMESRRIARQIIEIPPLDITVKPDVDIETLAPELEASPLKGTSLRRTEAGRITELLGFNEGHWWVQDIASSLPVQILNTQFGPLSDQTVFDLCAAPGGKTLQLASHGAQVTAIDKSAHRLTRLKENLTRCQLKAKVLIADVLELPDTLGQADHVLLDAPCTATGTFRRHPEVLYNRKPKDQAGLIKLQKKMLIKAADHVKVGGYLTFCTCSLQKSEGEAQITDFLQFRTDFRLNPILTQRCVYLDINMIEGGVLRTQPNFWSEIGGMDGFFMAILQKTG